MGALLFCQRALSSRGWSHPHCSTAPLAFASLVSVASMIMSVAIVICIFFVRPDVQGPPESFYFGCSGLCLRNADRLCLSRHVVSPAGSIQQHGDAYSSHRWGCGNSRDVIQHDANCA
jgi:hypothetical protein